jgi:hypothetical protein
MWSASWIGKRVDAVGDGVLDDGYERPVAAAEVHVRIRT